MKIVHCVALAAAVLLQAGLAATATPAPEEAPIELEPLIVTPSPLPLDEQALLLRLLILRSTPCLGCDAVLREPRLSRAAMVLRYLLVPAVPRQTDEAARLALDLKVLDSPDLEYLRP